MFYFVKMSKTGNTGFGGGDVQHTPPFFLIWKPGSQRGGVQHALPFFTMDTYLCFKWPFIETYPPLIERKAGATMAY